MNGNELLLDTNIILYILAGDRTIAQYLNEKVLFASVISEIELLGFQKLTLKEEKSVKGFLSQFRIIYIDDVIKNGAIDLRKQYNLKLPDCIIAATAISLNLPLITSDHQFKQIKTLQLELYQP